MADGSSFILPISDIEVLNNSRRFIQINLPAPTSNIAAVLGAGQKRTFLLLSDTFLPEFGGRSLELDRFKNTFIWGGVEMSGYHTGVVGIEG